MSPAAVSSNILLVFTAVSSIYHVASAEAQEQSLCYDGSLKFPPISTPPHLSGPMYFTPRGRGSRRRLMDNKKTYEPRLMIRGGSIHLMNLTESDSGIFSISFEDHPKAQTYDIIILTVNDCAKSFTKFYGEFFSHLIPENTEFIEVTPLHSPDPRQVLWNRTRPSTRGRVRVISGVLRFETVSQTDNGYYNFRSRNNTLLSRIRLSVQEYRKQYRAKVGDIVKMDYPEGTDKWTVTLTPEGDTEDEAIVMNSAPVNRFFYRRIISYRSDGMEITVQEGDAGTYTFKDPQKNLGMVVELTIYEPEESDDIVKQVAPALGVTVLVVSIVCCVKRGYCNERMVTNTSATQTTAAADPVHYHVQGTDRPVLQTFPAAPKNKVRYYKPPPPPPPNPTPPPTPTPNPTPDVSQGPTTSFLGPLSTPTPVVSQGPGTTLLGPSATDLGGEGAGPTFGSDWVASDPGLTYDFKGVKFLSTSDSTVYNSNKLHFK